ncbi:MAG: SAM-dependent chlorinase/fluorinase [Dehalococcoidales bacterium]
MITLTSDFGLSDGYVAAMKGVILGINPKVTIVDISHEIKPQDIFRAAFVLGTTAPYFPADTVHVVVVDPEVGTARSAIIAETALGFFVTPDNGSLSYVLKPYLLGSPKMGGDLPVKTGFDAKFGLKVYKIKEGSFLSSEVSNTFHGRDIFAPIAAYLTLGKNPIEFGEPAETVKVLPLPEPYVDTKGAVMGHIIYIDRFGNLITDIKLADIPVSFDSVIIEIGQEKIKGISKTYAVGAGLLAYIGSSGYLEIALKDGSAVSIFAAKIGDTVKLYDYLKGS